MEEDSVKTTREERLQILLRERHNAQENARADRSRKMDQLCNHNMDWMDKNRKHVDRRTEEIHQEMLQDLKDVSNKYDKEIRELQSVDRADCEFCHKNFCEWDAFCCEHCGKSGCKDCSSDGCIECTQHVSLCKICAERAGWNYWTYDCGETYCIECNSEHRHCAKCRAKFPSGNDDSFDY